MPHSIQDAMDLSRLGSCDYCEDLGSDHVPAIGTLAAELMIIGQSPGQHEVEAKEPFVGRCGEFVDLLIAELNMDRSDVYITNTLKCRPEGNRKGEPEEIKTCYTTWLKHEIRLLNPDVILFLGKDAWSVTPKGWEKKHGRMVKTKLQSFIFSYHPSFFLRKGDVRSWLKIAPMIQKELERRKGLH